MNKEFKYRLSKTSWGIAIDIIGDIVFLDTSKYNKWIIENIKGVSIGLEFSDQTNTFLSLQEKYFVKQAILFKKEAIAKQSITLGKTGVLFSLETIDFNLCDYQLEGLYIAVIKWLESKLTTEDIESINPHYNSETNRYEFPGISFPYSSPK